MSSSYERDLVKSKFRGLGRPGALDGRTTKDPVRSDGPPFKGSHAPSPAESHVVVRIARERSCALRAARRGVVGLIAERRRRLWLDADDLVSCPGSAFAA